MISLNMLAISSTALFLQLNNKIMYGIPLIVKAIGPPNAAMK